MQWTSEATQIVVIAAICVVQIIFRSLYRIFGSLKLFPTIQHRWHADDSWMAFSLIPLILRTTCMCWIFSLDKPLSIEDQSLSQKLVIGGRLTYALFLWCMKLCLLQFYTRLETGSIRVHRAIQLLGLGLFITYLIIATVTLLECRPLSLYWRPDAAHHPCRKGEVNLLTMAALNIATDVALILFPIPLLWRMTSLGVQAKLQLTLLFLVGILVVAITITRIPLIFSHSIAQESRTLWASIEIVCSNVVANAAFYYALWKELQRLYANFSHRTASLPRYRQRSDESVLQATLSPPSRIVSQGHAYFDERSSSELVDHQIHIFTHTNASFPYLAPAESRQSWYK
ncbi:hypothetical protein FQN57_006493 [Myotisia sp. PD_48]|nr:hypothetical protein FQN57_006493 [Myotisia sp. PD_48]